MVVLIDIRLGIDGVNPVDYDTIKVCDPFIFFHVRSIGVEGAAHTPPTPPQFVGIAGGPSIVLISLR